MGKNMHTLEHKNRRHAWLYLMPLIIFAAILLVYPIVTSIFLSFQKVKIPAAGVPLKLESLANYGRMFTDLRFYQALLNTIIIVLSATTVSLCLGVGLAVLVNKIASFRVLAILPWAIPSVTAAVAWGWLFDGSFGLFNWLLVKTGILNHPIVWNQSPGGAMFMVVAVLVWKGYPFITIMALAGLQSIPTQVYEAADVEGASVRTKLISITIPLIKPVIAVSGLLTALWIFRDYPIVYLLTGGGPIGRTRTLGLMTYQQAFESFNMGYGATVGVFTLAVCFLLSLLVVKMEGGK